MSARSPAQSPLFSTEQLPEIVIKPASGAQEYAELAARLPPNLRFGSMSWAYAGWRGIVYEENAPPKELPRAGLAPYSAHPLFRTVEIDRSAYDPPPVDFFQALAKDTPDDFRFVVKAHDHLTTRRFSMHARFGKLRGEANPKYFDASYAAEAVVHPTVEGLGDKLGVLLFQCPPQDVGEPPEAFADRVGEFLTRLPVGPRYGVEIRNRDLFTPAYAEALFAGGAIHSHNIRGDVPPLLAQVKMIPPPARSPLLIRWLMHPADTYEKASARFLPFDRLREEDLPNRAMVARILRLAAQHDVPTYALVDNKAEGSSPESIVRLARAVATPDPHEARST